MEKIFYVKIILYIDIEMEKRFNVKKKAFILTNTPMVRNTILNINPGVLYIYFFLIIIFFKYLLKQENDPNIGECRI